MPKNQPPDHERALADAEAVLTSATADAERTRVAYFEAPAPSKAAAKAAHESAEAFRRDAELERDAAKHRLAAARGVAAAEQLAADERRFAELERLTDRAAILAATKDLAAEEARILIKLAEVRTARAKERGRYRSLEIEHEALAKSLGRPFTPQSTWGQSPDGRVHTLPTSADAAIDPRPVLASLREQIDRCSNGDPLRLHLFALGPTPKTYQPTREFFQAES